MSNPSSAPGTAESRSDASSKHSLKRIPLGLHDPVPLSDMLGLHAVHLPVSTVRMLKCCCELESIKQKKA